MSVVRLAFDRQPPALDLADCRGLVRCDDCRHRAGLPPMGGHCAPGGWFIGSGSRSARRRCDAFTPNVTPDRLLTAAQTALWERRPEVAADLAAEAARLLRAEITRAAEAGGTA